MIPSFLPYKGRGTSEAGGGVSPLMVTPLRQGFALPPPLAGEE